jgi:hypothetical protein
MDSLMGLELKLAVERRFGVEVPLMTLTAGKSLADIVSHMIVQLRPAQGEEPAPGEPSVAATQGRALLEQHGAAPISADGFDRLAAAVEGRRRAITRFSG